MTGPAMEPGSKTEKRFQELLEVKVVDVTTIGQFAMNIIADVERIVYDEKNGKKSTGFDLLLAVLDAFWMEDRFSALVYFDTENKCHISLPSALFPRIEDALELDGRPLSSHVKNPELLLCALLMSYPKFFLAPNPNEMNNDKKSMYTLGAAYMLAARAGFLWSQSMCESSGSSCKLNASLVDMCIINPFQWMKNLGIMGDQNEMDEIERLAGELVGGVLQNGTGQQQHPLHQQESTGNDEKKRLFGGDYISPDDPSYLSDEKFFVKASSQSEKTEAEDISENAIETLGIKNKELTSRQLKTWKSLGNWLNAKNENISNILFDLPASTLSETRRKTIFSKLLCELAVRCCWFDHCAELVPVFLSKAAQHLNMQVKFTGIAGIKRKYQKFKLAQLVLVTKGGEPGLGKNIMSEDVVTTETGIAESIAIECKNPIKREKTEEEKEALAKRSVVFGEDTVVEFEKCEQSPSASTEASGASGEDEDEEPKPDRLRIITEQAKATGTVANIGLSDLDETTDLIEGGLLDDDVTEDGFSASCDLHPAAQLVLLGVGHYLTTQNPSKCPLMLSQLDAVAQRFLGGSIPSVNEQKSDDPVQIQERECKHNWLIFSTALWFRCRAEFDRILWRERACIQLGHLHDQFNDATSGATGIGAEHRLIYVTACGYPLRHQLQRDYGLKMRKVGMALTAYKMFLDLGMWDLAVEGLLIGGRREDCLRLLDRLLGCIGENGRVVYSGRCLMEMEQKKAMEDKDGDDDDCNQLPELPSHVKEVPEKQKCALLCVLGDMAGEKNVDDGLKFSSTEYYNLAWELSGNRLHRAMRSLGYLYFSKANVCGMKASEKIKNDVELRQSEEKQKQLPEMRDALEFFQLATDCFRKALAIHPNYPKAHYNLAQCLTRLTRYSEAISSLALSFKILISLLKFLRSFSDLPRFEINFRPTI